MNNNHGIGEEGVVGEGRREGVKGLGRGARNYESTNLRGVGDVRAGAILLPSQALAGLRALHWPH